MRYALVGCGRIARNHIAAAQRNNLEIVAVCDTDSQKARDLIQTHQLPPTVSVFTDYRELYRQLKPDLIAIATESGNHAEIAFQLIPLGCHLIIEKPIALSLADADRIIQLSESYGTTVSVCHQNRFNNAIQAARTALEQGRFGDLSHGSIQIRWNRDKNYYDQAPWRGTWAQDGGCLMNQCIHGIDLLRWMMGDDIESVSGTISQRFHDYMEAEDIGVAAVRFRSGAVGIIEGTVNVFPSNLEETLCVFGRDGTVKIGGTSCNNTEVWQFRDTRPQDADLSRLAEATSNVYGNGHTSLYADVIEAIGTGRPPYITAKAGRDALETVLAVYKSAQEKTSVALPLPSYSTLEMKGFFGDR